MRTIAIAAAGTLALLAVLHCYWAAGGNWGLNAVIPTVGGRPAIEPSVLACLVVAALLGGAALLAFAATGAFRGIVPGWFVRSGQAVVALVFLARSVGDFHLFGFAKSVHGTEFARMDTVLFSPLCVILALACGFLAAHRQEESGQD